MRVLHVELNPGHALSLGSRLADQPLVKVNGVAAALAAMRDESPEVVLVDIGTESGPNQEVTPGQAVQRLMQAQPQARIIVTGAGDDLLVYELLEQGVFDFLTYPGEIDALAYAVQRALRVAQIERQQASPTRGRRLVEVVPGIQTADPTMRRISRRAERLIGQPARVVLQGEAGTGRKTLAWMLTSPRRSSSSASEADTPPTLGSNVPMLLCSSVSRSADIEDFFERSRGQQPTMMDAHRRPAFAILDSVDELNPETQATLLRRLVEAEAGIRDSRLLPRLITIATAQLGTRIAEGLFRRDLYDRLAEVHLCLPALRNRGEDCVQLAEHFLQRYQTSLGRHRLRLSDEAVEAIRDHDWPGNVAELGNALKQAVITAEGPTIKSGDLGLASQTNTRLISLREAREDAERDAVQKALKRVNGNIARASEMLGISRPTLYDLLNKLGMR